MRIPDACAPTSNARSGDRAAAEGGFLHDADSYADELPYWNKRHADARGGTPQLVVPYTLDANDRRLATPAGFATGDDSHACLLDSFGMPNAEGGTTPRMLSVGLRCRLAGRPGRPGRPARTMALRRFLNHVRRRHDRVWICRRIDIARHWHEHHAPGAPPAGSGPSGSGANPS